MMYPCTPEISRSDFSLPCKLAKLFTTAWNSDVKAFKLSWPRYRWLHKRQNVRTSKACPPSSKETLSNTAPPAYSCKNLKWWCLHNLPVASHHTEHAQQAHHSLCRRKALPVAPPAQRGCGWKQHQEYVTKGALGQWGSHTLLRHNCGFDRQSHLKDLMLLTISLRLPSLPG